MKTDQIFIDEVKKISTINACKTCAPLGGSLAFKGVESCVPIVHGSQGCSTYIRRYLISHFREPIDIASSSFSEETTIFGGKDNLITAINNIIKQYKPKVIGILTSCLSETIGEDIKQYVNYFNINYNKDNKIILIFSNTPSYKGTHYDGYLITSKAIVEQFSLFAENKSKDSNLYKNYIGIFPSLISPADIRELKNILNDFEINYIIVPDYSDPLDGPIQDFYQLIPEGGTKIDDLKNISNIKYFIQFGKSITDENSIALFLNRTYGINYSINFIPIGLQSTDEFFNILSEISGKPIPEKYKLERGRLIDSYVDGHKYLFGKRAVIYGEEDLVISLARFFLEIGVVPSLCATGGKSEKLKPIIDSFKRFSKSEITVLDRADFDDIEKFVKENKPDFMIGSSKGVHISRNYDVPLLRIGFPIHDRFGAQRILSIGYRGTQILFDAITNLLMERKQKSSEINYFYV